MTNSTLPTANEDWGFFRTAAGFTDAAKAWEIASPAIAKVTMGSAEGVRDFLDSRHGRHFADDVHNGIYSGLGLAAAIDAATTGINVAVEAYPDLQAQQNVAEAMRQNAYLQQEITAARNLYNDTVATWNRVIYSWPTNQIVAAKAGYTTRIPFIASAKTKDAARGTFF